MEGQTYPIELRRVVSQFNKGHGLYVKAPNTTVYNLYDCEFGYNDLYGAYLEDGSTCLWENVLIQSNKQGGLKMVQQDGNAYTFPIFLERFTFINLYTEANGTLDPANPKYEGNYALRIEGKNHDPLTAMGKIFDLTFINGSINKSSTGNYAYIRGTDRLNVIGTDVLNNAIDPLYNRGIYRQVGTSQLEGLLDISQGRGGQIKFPATQNPSTHPNVLDDYEEGTFNFEVGQNGGNSFTSTATKTARYIKVGSLVTCFIDYSWTSKNGSSDAFFCVAKNLPFRVTGGTYQAASFVDMIITGGTTDRWAIYPNAGSSICQFIKNGAEGFATISTFPTSGQLSCMFSYIAET
jgi:hypothetical protein